MANLQSPNEPAPVPPVTNRDHQLGPETALVTLVEYGDYECPYTAAAYPFLMQLSQTLGSRFRLVFRNFPLTEVHPHAELAAEAAEAAGAQGKFWQMHARLLEHQQALGDREILRLAEEAGLDMQRFAHDMGAYAAAGRVRDDVEGGQRAGVHGTPTFFLNGR